MATKISAGNRDAVEPAIPALEKMLSDKDPALRDCAMRALISFRVIKKKVLDNLLLFVADAGKGDYDRRKAGRILANSEYRLKIPKLVDSNPSLAEFFPELDEIRREAAAVKKADKK